MIGTVWLTLAGVWMLPGAEAGAETFSRNTPVVQAVQKISPAVVNISSSMRCGTGSILFSFSGGSVFPGFFFFFFFFFDPGVERKADAYRSWVGVIIDGERGLILTNEHVVVKTGTITVILNDGREFQADLVGADPQTDLAVLRIDARDHLPSIAMGNSADLMIGETVIAISNPFGFKHRDHRGH
ncbi:MAG: trypsin-like peptidase domain-containing protein [Desulfobacterales bacterium]